MGNIANEIICHNCKQTSNLKIQREGISEYGVMYYSTNPTDTYLISPEYIPSKKFLKSEFSTIQQLYIPRFGKVEIENFITKEILSAIFITKNLSLLFSTTILMYDTYVDPIYFSANDLKERLLPLFEITKQHYTYFCKFKEEILEK